jgi:hypothetical protein
LDLSTRKPIDYFGKAGDSSARTREADSTKPAEIRAITEREVERMIEMNDDELQAAVTRYAEDFGPKAAAQL